MKKKLVSYLVLACSVFGLTMVGSCKDYDFDVLQDQINYLEQDHVVNLGKKLQDMQDSIDALRGRVAAIKSCECTGTGSGCSVNCDSLANALDSLYKYIGEIAGDSIGTVIPGYTGGNGLSGILTYINSQLTNAANLAQKADSAAQDVAQELKDLRYGWSDSLKKAYDTAFAAFDQAKENKAKIDELLLNDSIQDEKIDSLAQVTDDLYDLAEQYLDSAKAWADSVANNVKIELSTRIDSVEAQYKRADSLIQKNIENAWDSIRANKQRIDEIAEQIDEIEARLDTVEEAIKDLADAESKRITSLYVQGAVNPIFGSFALPFGIKSNILATYYGKATKSSLFPATGMDDLSALVDEGMQLSDAEASVIGVVNQISTTSGQTLAGSDEGNAGRIFLTVNPNEVELDSTYKFTFVTSDGAETKATIGELVPSTEKLTFGLQTKASSESGFYEAPVTISADDADALSPELAVTKEQLKSIAKDIVSYKDGINLTDIAGAVFQLVQTKLDANAVKVEWSDSLGDHSVTSYYDVAVTALKPLSYNALEGKTISKKLPTISNISELNVNLDDLSFDIDLSDITFTINGSAAHITFGQIIIDTTDVAVKVKASVPNSVDVTTGKVNGYVDSVYTVEGLGKVLKDVEKTFNNETVKWQDSVNSVIDSLVAKINKEVNTAVADMLTDIQGNLNTPIQKLLDDVKASINNSLSGYNGYFNKMNSLIDRINGLTNKINSKLNANLGTYVLPMVAYESANGSLHLMSNDKAIPSLFAGSGDGGTKLYLTSYTAELLAPAYKKYIAVVDYVMPDGITHDTSVAKAVNNSNEYFNTVIDGKQFAVPFAPTQKGTYTIYYSAIDYSGAIASGRFYVTVK